MDELDSEPAKPNRIRTLGDDPLSASLTYLAAYHGRAVSREALLGGLPILDGKLSVALYDRAARRAGLETEAVKRHIIDIPALVLPAVLIMRNGTALILLGIDDADKSAKVLDATVTPSVARVAPIGAITADYTGYAFLVRAAAEADARAVAAGDIPRNHWFWSVVKVHWRSYGHIALAAFLTNMLALATPLFTMSVYDRVVPNGAIPSLIALSIGMGLAIAFDFLFRMVRSRMIDVTGKTVDVVLAANIFEHVMAVKMAQRPPSVGIIANQLRDFDSVREFFTSGSVVSATDLIFAVLFIGVLFIIAGPLAWIPLIMLPIMMLIGFVLQRPLDRAMKRLQAESAARHGVLVESLSGIETVRATGAEARMQTASPQRAYVARKIDEGRIAFENVSFAYPGAPGNALEKVSFKIEGGERVGIIGRVGSGKTTVGRLLLGFYEAKEGRILVDGVDSRQYDPADLRTGIGFAMQDTDLFFGKLRDNIALGKPEATDEEILNAARLSGVESFIAGHPMGYDMPISEGGRSLSGGQKQAIGLARVLIRKPKVLFLDEPTAHFDIRSEAEFLERLKAIRGEQMTIIISTHRLSLLNMVDRLLLFDNGRLVADGPRDKVLAILQGKPVAAAPAPLQENTMQPKSA